MFDGGELRLVYRSEQAGWTPLYRARLDTATGKLSVERRAEASQQTGVDLELLKAMIAVESGFKADVVSPRGATGRVYGVVYSGLDAGLVVAPLLFGMLMDAGPLRRPRCCAACSGSCSSVGVRRSRQACRKHGGR